ncbi:general substrate transporter [Xylariomycetidae sp. FL0641]|nr:general substrate transporter [Xylariomycetidae sp. FL0641]
METPQEEDRPSTWTGFKLMLQKMTPSLFVAWILTSILNILFGYDTTSFGGVQSIQAFGHQFGSYDPSTGDWTLSAGQASFINSIGFLGKFFGALPIGHRYSIWLVCVISWVGIVLECTSHTVAQFVIGRIIVYYSVGFAEICATTYQSEIVPASMRGAVVGSIQLFNQIGQILAAGVNRRYSMSMQPSGWIIPVAVQAIAPVIIAVGVFFIPDGPRWLISKGRMEDSIVALKRLRSEEDVDSGRCKAEAEAIREALVHGVEKGPWRDLFRGTNLRRTSIATVIFIFQQFTGQAFVSNYSPRFYDAVGLSAHAFDYNIGSATLGFVGVALGMPFIDMAGRRTVLIVGCTGQAIFLFIVAGVGLPSQPNANEANTLVASVMLYNFFYAGTIAAVSYVIGAEIGTAALREKTMALTTSISIFAAFIVAFSIPYILDDIGANIGWVFGGMATLATIYTYFCVPETKNRSLEELDELFEKRVSARKFASTETTGAGRK